MAIRNEESNIDYFDTFCGANERKKLMDKKYFIEMKSTMRHIKNTIDNDIVDLYKYDIERGYDSKGVLGSRSDIIRMYKLFFSGPNSSSNDLNNKTYYSSLKQKRKITKKKPFNTYSNIFQKNKKSTNTKKIIYDSEKESISKNLIKSFNKTNNFILRNQNNHLLYKNNTTNNNFASTNDTIKKDKSQNNKKVLNTNNTAIPKNNSNNISSLFNLTGNSDKINFHINKKIFDYSYKPKLIQKLVSINDASDNFIQNLETQKLKDIKYKKFFKRQFIASKWKLITEDEKVMRSPNNNLEKINKSSSLFGRNYNRLSNTTSDLRSMNRYSNYKDYLEDIDSSLDKIKKRIKKEKEFCKNIQDIFHENDMVIYNYKKIDKRLHNNYKKFK